jgi:hypothetical protein
MLLSNEEASAETAPAVAEPPAPTPVTEPDPPPVTAPDFTLPTEQYPRPEGSVGYDALPPAAKAAADRAAEWAEADSGHAVHSAWSSYTREMAAAAKVEHATRAAGLAGVGEIGVE